jgi:catechol 2,3-dioxygenase-like lactoylglutathione lyase family enzyme
MSIPANFSIVTLGVADLDRSAAFYRQLGWEQRGDQAAGITWFRTSGTWIGLFDSAELAADVGLPVNSPDGFPDGFRGMTLALNFASVGEVDAALAHAVRCGARVVKPAAAAEWGGYSGYFADPDGHLWEVAFAPGFPVAADGTIEITG